uniref:C-type lectin domain-containing protein n=1 Tax=Neogobius melanostomus TaxID=47308 RepID=A0A8C6UEW7_9GOBI
MAVNFPPITFLCLAGALLTAGAAAGFEPECPANWTPFGTRCFKFTDSSLTWTQAEKLCQSEGANLASIHSAEENAFVIDLIQKATGVSRRTWIGGHDAFQDNLWMWSDGSVWNYSDWNVHQPDNWNGNETFVEINHRVQGSNARWNDLMEDALRAYICAKDMTPCP